MKTILVLFIFCCAFFNSHAMVIANTTSNTAKSLADIPAEIFFQRPHRVNVISSPDGSKFAAIDLIDKRLSVVTYDIKLDKNIIVARFADADVTRVEWVNNERLLITVRSMVGERFNQNGLSWVTVKVDGTGLHSSSQVDFNFLYSGERDESISMQVVRTKLLGNTDDIVISASSRYEPARRLFRYNLATKRATPIETGGSFGASTWMLDSDDKPAIAISYGEKNSVSNVTPIIYWHKPNNKWVKFAHFESTNDAFYFTALGVDADNKTLYVTSRQGKDRVGLYKYDLSQGKVTDLIYEHPTRDFNGNLIFSGDNKKLLGLQHEAERPTLHWFNEDMRKLQTQIDSALPNTINILKTKNFSNQYMIVYALSATEPGINYLYDREKKRLELLNHIRPWLPSPLSKRERVDVIARDGLKLEAWVTLPKTSVTTKSVKPPLIVIVASSPQTPISYGADGFGLPTAQYFASRGYAVVEPVVRGTYGYSHAFYLAGQNQLGRKTQDDIVDVVNHLDKLGQIDSSRMCLLGNHLGGYAALMALTRDPLLWRCASVSDTLTEMTSDSDNVQAKLIIEEAKLNKIDTEALLKQLSPLANIDKMQAPVRLSYDKNDKGITLKQGQHFFQAMTEAKKKVTLTIDAPDQSPTANHNRYVEFIKQSEQFFAEYLSPQTPQAK
jgi:dipeptidyl aminopeptidase/acylaminoacyl peptidase